MKRIILVTGATRGLGRAAATDLAKKGHTVIFSGRDRATLGESVSGLKDFKADFVELHVDDERSIAHAKKYVQDKYGRLDTLINNAGVLMDEDHTLWDIPGHVILDTFMTNTLGPLKLVQELLPLLKKSPEPIIVNVSSGMGQIKDMGTGYAAYRLSKTGLNVLTILMHNELHTQGFKVNSVCPGWVKTDMGGPGATRDLAQGISGIVWAATLEKGGPSGGFFRDGKRLEW